MTTEAEPPSVKVKKRRTEAELKAHHERAIKALEERGEVKAKLRLMKIAAELKELSELRPNEKHLAQSAAQILGFAQAIRVEIPQ